MRTSGRRRRVFLIAVGAILAFATHASVGGLDLTVVRIVLMVAGVIGLLVTLLIWRPRAAGGAGGARVR